MMVVETRSVICEDKEQSAMEAAMRELFCDEEKCESASCRFSDDAGGLSLLPVGVGCVLYREGRLR